MSQRSRRRWEAPKHGDGGWRAETRRSEAVAERGPVCRSIDLFQLHVSALLQALEGGVYRKYEPVVAVQGKETISFLF